jgi:hypothetical protein
MKLMGPAGAALIDAQLRWLYPHRFEGEHVVMIYDQAEDVEHQVAAMDRHIARLDAILGRSSKAKVHWVRGRAGGFDGRYFQGIALGSCPDPDLEIGSDGLTWLDRQEVAHLVISQHCGPDSEPPFLTRSLLENGARSSVSTPSRKDGHDGASLPQPHRELQSLPCAQVLRPPGRLLGRFLGTAP